MGGRATRSQKLLSQPASRAKWTASLTKLLLDLMAEQVTKGFITKKAWTLVRSAFHNKTGLNWDVHQLRSRHAILRRHYLTLDSLLASNLASKPLWDKYIKDLPDAQTLKSNGFHFYKQLFRLFSETPSTSKTPQLKETVSHNSSEVEKEPTCSVDVTPKRGRQGLNGLIAKAIMEMALASKLTAQAISKCNQRFSIANSIKALDELQGINEEEYHAALDLLDNHTAREIFLSLKPDKRLPWLRTKCFVSSNYKS